MHFLRNLAAATGVSLLALATSAHAEPQRFVFDDPHTDVTFRVTHLGYSQTHGRFNSVAGSLMIDAQDAENSSLDVVIETASVDTAWEKRDAHLKTADFFDVEKYPTMNFVSSAVSQTGENTLVVSGDLTILGQSHPVDLDVVINKLGPHPRSGVMMVGATASAQILRSKWGMTRGVPGIADEIDLLIDIEAMLDE